MKFLKICRVLFLGCTFLIGCDGKKDGTSSTLTVGVSADYAPFEFFKDGEIVGFDIDLMKEITNRLGKNVHFKDMSFEAILGSLVTHRIDAAISSITPTPERRKSVDFSQEYIHSNRVMICKGTSSIQSVTDLAERKVGVQSGSTHEVYVQDTLSKDVRLTSKSLARIPDLLQDLEIGNISGIILGNPEAESIMKLGQKNLKIISLPGEVSGSAIAFSKGSSLTAQVDKVLDDLKNDGTLTRLKEKWFPAS